LVSETKRSQCDKENNLQLQSLQRHQHEFVNRQRKTRNNLAEVD